MNIYTVSNGIIDTLSVIVEYNSLSILDQILSNIFKPIIILIG